MNAILKKGTKVGGSIEVEERKETKNNQNALCTWSTFEVLLKIATPHQKKINCISHTCMKLLFLSDWVLEEKLSFHGGQEAE